MNMAVTNVLVLFAWLFFRAKTFADAQYFLDNIFHWQSDNLASRMITITTCFLLVMILLDALEYGSRSHIYLLRIKSRAAVRGICAAMMLVIFLYMATSTPLPFVYFQF